MPEVEFSPALQRHVACPLQTVAGETLRAALEDAFAAAPPLRDYVLDEQNGVRKHVAIFVNGALVRDRRNLEQVLAPSDRVYVAQALSGG